MIIDRTDLKTGILRITTESADDLWTLYCVLETGDIVRMRTLRKVKVGGSDRGQGVDKRPMTLFLRTERVSFETGALKILGTVVEGPDDVPKGSHHSFHVDERSDLSIRKFWKEYQLKRLEIAEKASVLKILLVVCDREHAFLAVLKQSGYAMYGRITADITKKRTGVSGKDDSVFPSLRKKLEELHKEGFSSVIIGCPSFWHPQIKTQIIALLPDMKISVATVSAVDTAGIDELLKRPETKSLLAEQRATREIDMVDGFLAHMGQEKPYTYGINDCIHAAKMGAVAVLLVSEALIVRLRENNDFGRLEHLLRLVEDAKGEVHLISPDHEGGKKLDGLSGVVATLRYAL